MITLEVRERVMPIGAKKGKRLYYAIPKELKRISAKQLEDQVVNTTSLARGDVRNALTTFTECVQKALQEGTSVDLGELGTLKVLVGSQMQEEAELVSEETLKTPIIRFYPKKEMVQIIKQVEVKVENQHIRQQARHCEERSNEAISQS